MNLKLPMAVTIFAAAPIVAFAQKDDPGKPSAEADFG